jgi:acyl-CoA dehydrogenase
LRNSRRAVAVSHTLLHFGTPEQKERYLRPLCDGLQRSCFAMTEPEVAGSDPTLIQTSAVKNGDHWVVNGHKWFISGARGASFAILIARTDPDADPPQARNTAFLVDLPAEGWEIVRDVETMAGGHNHCEIRIENLRLPDSAILGGRGQGHRLGQVRLGPARLAHCMRWIGQVETALEMLIERATKRFAHGSLLSEKQGIQWMVSESAMELYAAQAGERWGSVGQGLILGCSVTFPGLSFLRPTRSLEQCAAWSVDSAPASAAPRLRRSTAPS